MHDDIINHLCSGVNYIVARVGYCLVIHFQFPLSSHPRFLPSFLPSPSMDEKPDLEPEPEPVEFPDEWELLHSNPDEPLDFAPPLIQPDYFSLHTNHFPNSNSNDSASNSSTDPSEVDRNFDDSYVANQLFPSGETYLIQDKLSTSSSPSPSPSPSPSSSSASNAEIFNEPDPDSAAAAKMKMLVDDTATSSELLDAGTGGGGGGGLDDVKGEDELVEEVEEEKKEERRVAWWKVPLEVFKYWVVRVNPVVPVWSLSVAAAAAFLGLVILGRRLYKMKRKTQTLKLNVVIDDKVIILFILVF
ncbi:hypothetical protein RIF29_25515 [Crotalaria pallida]|uniref:Uncharacterized protein n=1 Tax=Crotalaria pallida TaxID=3830 RepID=A0AAN9I162_CROPI